MFNYNNLPRHLTLMLTKWNNSYLWICILSWLYHLRSFISLIVLHGFLSASSCLEQWIFCYMAPAKTQQSIFQSSRSTDTTDESILPNNLNFLIKWRSIVIYVVGPKPLHASVHENCRWCENEIARKWQW